MDSDAAIAAEGEASLKTVENFFAGSLNPNIFTYDNSKNAVVVYENNYNNLCAALETAGHHTKDLTVMELYSKLKYFNDVNKPRNG